MVNTEPDGSVSSPLIGGPSNGAGGREPLSDAPSSWIVRWAHLVQPSGSVLDVACGGGRHARWLAGRGFAVTAVDRSLAAVEALPAGIHGVVADLEGAPWPFGHQRFDAIVVTKYLWRPLMPALLDALADNGVLLYETFALGQEAIGRPRNPAFLLAREELLVLVNGLRIVAFEDGYDHATHAQLQRVVAVREAEGSAVSPRHSLSPEGLAHHG